MKQNYYEKLFSKSFFMAFPFLFFALGLNAQVTSFPWTETFEDSSPTRDAWTQIYEVNTMSWTFATSPSTGGYMGAQPASSVAYEGSKMANYPATSHNFDRTKLVSPVLDLSAVVNPTVSFFYRNPFWSPDQNWLRIFYRTSDSSPWIQIVEFHSDIPSWTSSGDLALPNPSATYQIAIDCETDYGYSTTVDSVLVQGTLSNANFSGKLISYYPNPTHDILHFSSNEVVSEILVFNLLGQKMIETKVNSNEGQVDLSNLTNGNYIIRAFTEAGSENFKVVKK